MSLPIVRADMSIEEIAEVVEQLAPAEKLLLLDLVPDLDRLAIKPLPKTSAEIKASATILQPRVITAHNHKPIPHDTPFLGGLTLGQYLALPDEEQGRIWDSAAEIDMMELEEVEVSPNALLTR